MLFAVCDANFVHGSSDLVLHRSCINKCRRNLHEGHVNYSVGSCLRKSMNVPGNPSLQIQQMEGGMGGRFFSSLNSNRKEN